MVKIKQKPADFKVTELLKRDTIKERGEHRVYRVTKRRHTSIEAAQVLADLAGVHTGDVSMAGLKDRQGVTRQYMSIPKGKSVSVNQPELTIETVGLAEQELSSDDSEGNAFEIIVRDLGEVETRRARTAIEVVRTHGLPNYFDDQRFGNLRHNQGWIAKDLMLGRTEGALKSLLTIISDYDHKSARAFKSALFRHWGDWRSCRDIAGKFGQHHSVFEHLRKNHDDFAGAFRFVSSRIRLIHLYAFQSHIWNRVLAQTIEAEVEPKKRFAERAREGKLVFPKYESHLPTAWKNQLPLPGNELDGVTEKDQLGRFHEALKREGLSREQFKIEGVTGFALKPEPRTAVVVPRELRMRPAEPDNLNRGQKLVRLTFSLPRGSYATLVVRRLMGSFHAGRRFSRAPRESRSK